MNMTYFNYPKYMEAYEFLSRCDEEELSYEERCDQYGKKTVDEAIEIFHAGNRLLRQLSRH